MSNTLVVESILLNAWGLDERLVRLGASYLAASFKLQNNAAKDCCQIADLQHCLLASVPVTLPADDELNPAVWMGTEQCGMVLRMHTSELPGVI